MTHAYAMSAETPDDRGADGPAAMARASRMVSIEGRAGGSGKARGVETIARRYEVECRLDGLRARGTISQAEWQAGMMFRMAWAKVAAGGRITADLLAQVRSSGAFSVHDVEYWQECRSRIDGAYKLLTEQQRLAVVAVCGQDEQIERTEEGRNRSRIRHLKDGLTILAAAWVKPVTDLYRK